MARTRLNPRLAKLHRSYTVEETARLFGLHRNTVRNWLGAGLPIIDDRRPVLIQGKVLRIFLEARRAAAKCPCPPGTLYCLKCRAPRRPALGMADFLVRETGPGNLRTLCDTCETIMHRRASLAAIGLILPGVDIQIVRAPSRIVECRIPSVNCI
jgi:hypothetical protein